MPDDGCRARRHVHADLHVGDDRRAEGGADGSRTAGGLRREARRDVRPRSRRRLLLRHAAVPFQRGRRRLRGRRSRRARPPFCAGASPPRTSCPTSAATASRSSTTSASRSATSSRRRSCPDDADNTLRIAFGNEAAPLDIDRFAQRFGCVVADGYGSTEGGLNMSRTPDTPQGSLGLPVAADPRGDPRPRDRRASVRSPRSSTPPAGCSMPRRRSARS